MKKNINIINKNNIIFIILTTSRTIVKSHLELEKYIIINQVILVF